MKLTSIKTERPGVVTICDFLGRPIEGLRRPATQEPGEAIAEFEATIYTATGHPQLGIAAAWTENRDRFDLDPSGPMRLGLRIERGLLVPHDLATNEAICDVRDVTVYQNHEDISTMVIRVVTYEPEKGQPQLPRSLAQQELDAWAVGLDRLRTRREESRLAARDAIASMLREYEAEFDEPYLKAMAGAA